MTLFTLPLLLLLLLPPTHAFAETGVDLNTADGRLRSLAGLARRDRSFLFAYDRELYDALVQSGRNGPLLTALGDNGSQEVEAGSGRLTLNYIPGWVGPYVNPYVDRLAGDAASLPLTELTSLEADLRILQREHPATFEANAARLVRLAPLLYSGDRFSALPLARARELVEELRQETEWTRFHILYTDYFQEHILPRLLSLGTERGFAPVLAAATSFERSYGLHLAVQGMSPERRQGARNVRLTRLAPGEVQLLGAMPQFRGKELPNPRTALLRGARVYLLSHGGNPANVAVVIAVPVTVVEENGRTSTAPYLMELTNTGAALPRSAIRDVLGLLQRDFGTSRAALSPAIARAHGLVGLASPSNVEMAPGWATLQRELGVTGADAAPTRAVHVGDFSPLRAVHVATEPMHTPELDRLDPTLRATVYGLASLQVPGRGRMRHADTIGPPTVSVARALGIPDAERDSAFNATKLARDLHEDALFNRLNREPILLGHERTGRAVDARYLFPMITPVLDGFTGTAAQRAALERAALRVWLSADAPWTPEAYAAVSRMTHLLPPGETDHTLEPRDVESLERLAERMYRTPEANGVSWLATQLARHRGLGPQYARVFLTAWLREPRTAPMPEYLGELFYESMSEGELARLIATTRHPERLPDLRLVPQTRRAELARRLEAAATALEPGEARRALMSVLERVRRLPGCEPEIEAFAPPPSGS